MRFCHSCLIILLNEIGLKFVVATAAELGLKKIEIKRLQRMASEWK